MCQLFHRLESGEWQALALAGETLSLIGESASVAVGSAAASPPSHAPVLRRLASPSGDTWLLLAPESSKVRVNGRPLVTGLWVLSHRDAVQLGAAPPLFFSTERVAVIEPFAGGPDPVFCPRCKTVVAAGSPAARCPSCSTVFHQSEALPCFDYGEISGEVCPICGERTALDGELRWTPAEV